MTREHYSPVPLDVNATRKRWAKDATFKTAYNALADEFATLTELVNARQKAKLTQAEVAKRMGITQASVGRLESSAGNRKHAPSVATLRRYADAVGCELHITLSPVAKRVNSRHTASRDSANA